MANYKTKIEYLQEAINSILNQTYKNFELLIIDDCSRDESIEYLKSIKDDRIKLIINEKNSGPSVSRNRGLTQAKGKYIAIMDSDDVSLPTRLEEQVDYMEKNPDVIVCGTWFEKFGIENRIRKPIIDNFEIYRCQLLFSNTPITLCSPSAMIRKSMLDDYSIRYDESLAKSEDYGLWVDCSKVARIYIIKKVLVRYRTHERQTSIKDKFEQTEYENLISRRQLQELGIDFCEEENRWRYDRVIGEKDFQNFYFWVERIRLANYKSKLIQNNDMKTYLNNKLLNAVKRATKPEIVKIFFRNRVGRQIIIQLVKNAIKKRLMQSSG